MYEYLAWSRFSLLSNPSSTHWIPDKVPLQAMVIVSNYKLTMYVVLYLLRLISNGDACVDVNTHIIIIIILCVCVYCTNHLQLKRPTCVTCMSHMCNTCGVNHTRVGFLASTYTYTHTQFLHTHVHAHTVFTLTCVVTRVHTCMANVASMLTSYLPTSLSYNATFLVTLFFPNRALVAHQ